jgi:hypothetical protein
LSVLQEKLSIHEHNECGRAFPRTLWKMMIARAELSRQRQYMPHATYASFSISFFVFLNPLGPLQVKPNERWLGKILRRRPFSLRRMTKIKLKQLVANSLQARVSKILTLH